MLHRTAVLIRNVIIQLRDDRRLKQIKICFCFTHKSPNKAGSYQCICKTGFKTDSANPMACIDIDECTGKTVERCLTEVNTILF